MVVDVEVSKNTATGVRIREGPMTSARVLSELEAAGVV